MSAEPNRLSGDASDWPELDAALDILVELPAAERPGAIDRLAGANARLRARLVSLCANLDGVDSMLDRPAVSLVDADAPQEPPGQGRFGAWRIEALVGRGGMGEVYRVRRDDGAYQQVAALKLMRAGVADDTRRFERERQTLARLDHPAIARLLDGGVSDDGQPFMVLEFVDGEPITTWCRSMNLPLARRLDLFAQVCNAVAFAHQHLVVHLDIKPANVLVSKDGRVKLLDFGIARLLQAPDDATTPTLHLALTPGYAAPEQWSGGPVSTAADIYALGMLLHELLVGEPAWRIHGVPTDAGAQGRTRGPLPAPSRHAATHDDPPVDPRLLRGDLDAIVAKATRQEPEQRYASVGTLGADVRRHLAHQAVSAREGARLYELGRLIRRYRAWAASIAVSAAALVVGAGAVAWQAHRADVEARKASAERDFLVDIFRHNAEDNPGGAQARQVTAGQLLERAADRIPTALAGQREVRAEMEDTLYELFDQLQDYPRTLAFERRRLDEIRRLDGDKPSRERAQVQFGLGRAQLMTGDFAGAAATLAQAAATLDALGDQRSSLRADVLMHQARVAYRRAGPGDLAAAADLAARAQALYPPDNMNWIYAGQLLARVQLNRGAGEEADRAMQALVDVARRPPFDANPVTAAYIELDLGSNLMDQARFSRAAPLLADALQRMTRADGPRQPNAILARFYVAESRLLTGEPAAGQSALEEAVADFEQSAGRDNVIWTLPMRTNAARFAMRRGNLAGALASINETLARYDARAPHDRNSLPAALLTQAQLQLALGHDDLARAAFERASRLFPPGERLHNVSTGRRALVEALLLADAGDVDAARRQLEQVRAGWAWSPTLLLEPGIAATFALAELDLAQGRPQAVRPLVQPLLDRLQSDPEHVALVDWISRAEMLQAEAAIAQSDPAGAAATLGQALALRTGFDAADSVWVARLRGDLARALALQGRAQEAAAAGVLARRALVAQSALQAPAARMPGASPALP